VEPTKLLKRPTTVAKVNKGNGKAGISPDKFINCPILQLNRGQVETKRILAKNWSATTKERRQTQTAAWAFITTT